jgi:hypothetical protein
MAAKKNKTTKTAPAVYSADFAANGNRPLTPKEILQRKCLLVEDVTDSLKITRNTLAKYCEKFSLPVSQLDKRIYFDLDDILEMLQKNKILRKPKKKS